MEPLDRARTVAEATWEALRRHGIPPTPRSFEVWFNYCADAKPRLRQRIDRLIEVTQSITPVMLDELYSEFFGIPVDLSFIRDNSRQLQDIATQLADRVTASYGPIFACGSTFDEWIPLLDTAPTAQEMRLVATTLKNVTADAGDRMRTLEQLLAASIIQIGELTEKLAQAEKEATCDALTGLANRRMFDSTLLQTTVQATSDGFEVALLMLDIDHFKKFNDSFGHPTGDSVLRLVAQILTSHIKGRDTAARYGGEEFAIILVGAGLAAALTVGEQIRGILGKRSLVNRTTGQNLGVVTCSIGVALYRPGEATGTFIDRADKALYRAKRAGRNQVAGETADGRADSLD